MREAALNPFASRAPAAGDAVVVVRPPPGLGRGVVAVPPAVVVLLVAGLALLTLGYYALGLRRARRR